MKKTGLVLGLATATMLAGCCGGRCMRPSCCRGDDPVMGNWAGELPFAAMPATAFRFERGAKGEPKAFVLYRWGSPEWCEDVQVRGNSFSLRHPYGILFRGTVKDNAMSVEFATYDRQTLLRNSDWTVFNARREPNIEPAKTSDAKFGKPIDLLADGLDGWKSMDEKAKFGWSFKDGILSNKLGLKPDGSWAGGGANLMSKRADFYDFNLEYDVRVPKGSNSGVYLRGRYEVQVVDSFGKEKDRHNMAAYYGRGCPAVSAEKPAGEWQHVSVTLYKRHLTVVLNGKTILDNVLVNGVTGGAIDSNQFVPGPIYLQGDHSDADFRNMILRPAI